jgi:hypothetical protein
MSVLVSVTPPEGTARTNIPAGGIRIDGLGGGVVVLGISGDPALQDEIRYEVHEDGSVTTDIPGCDAVIAGGCITGFRFGPGPAA